MLAAHSNVTLLTGAYVSRLETDETGRRVSAVHVERGGEDEAYTADTRGRRLRRALISAAPASLRQRAASERPGQRLRSGRAQLHAPRHEHRHGGDARTERNGVSENAGARATSILAATTGTTRSGSSRCAPRATPTRSWARRLPSWLEWLPDMPFEEMARHSMDFWLQAEDLPNPDNRIHYKDGKVHLDSGRNQPAGARTPEAQVGASAVRHRLARQALERSLYLGKNIPLRGTAHQAGTCRFGADPATSVLNLDCRAHEVDNLYVTDASFFPVDRRGQSDPDDHRQCLARRRHPEGPAVTAAGVVELLVRYGLVMLFLPFSALDKVFGFDHAVRQAQQVVKPRIVRRRGI